VDYPDIEDAALSARVEVVADDGRDVSGCERMQVQDPVDGELDRLFGIALHRTLIAEAAPPVLTDPAGPFTAGARSGMMTGRSTQPARSTAMHARLVAAALAAALAVPATALEYHGVRVPDTLTLGGTELQRNGTGMRKRFVVKVYVGSLYLTAPSREADAVIAADAPKAVQLHFVRDVGRNQMLDAFREGFQNNSADQAAKLLPKLEQLAAALPDKAKEGSTLLIGWVPGKGTLVQAQGGREVFIEGKDFNDALMRNWLGPQPADGDLKRKMLNR
jgi:hypothetical protein